MAQPNDFRYFLTLDNEKTQIIFAPEGWDQDTVVSYIRSETYFGMVRSMAFPLQFVLDGADLLRRAYYTYGVEAEVRFEVEQLQKDLGSSVVWKYKPFFRGDVNFSQFRDYQDHVSVTLSESGISRNIKARENVKFEYPLIGTDVANVILPGVKFTESAEWVSYSIGGNNRFIPESTVGAGNFKSGFVTSQNTIQQNVGDGSFAGSDNWFVQANRNQTIRLRGRFKGNYVQFLGGPGFQILIKDHTNATVETIYNYPGGGAVNYDVSFDRTINMVNGQKLFLYFRTNGTGGNVLNLEPVDSSFNVGYSSQSDPSNCAAITGFNLYKRIIGRVSPGTAINSYLLKGKWKNLMFTSGDGIREIKGAKIKIAWKEFYDTINSIEDVSFGQENNIAVLEEANYFARPLKIADLGEVKECEITPAQEFLFNSIKIGYNDGNTDEENGREEYNSGQQWGMPFTQIQKEKNWVSPTRADQYGIEKIRLDYNVKKEKSTNDTSSDNDTFMIDCYIDGANYRPILGASYDSVTGLTSPETAYNLELSPKKNLLRHQGYLRSIMDRMEGRYINFASGTKNTALATVKNGVLVKEDEDILSSSLTGKYFSPNIATVTTKLPRNIMWIMDNMLFGYLEFTYRDTVLKGYLMDVPVDIARNTEQSLKLLLTDDNNLLNLI